MAIWRAARAAAVIAILALFLMKGRSRVAALLLLLESLGEATVTVLNRLGATSPGGINVFVAVIMVIAAFRAVEATFKLRGFVLPFLHSWPWRYSGSAHACDVPPLRVRHVTPGL